MVGVDVLISDFSEYLLLARAEISARIPVYVWNHLLISFFSQSEVHQSSRKEFNAGIIYTSVQ